MRGAGVNGGTEVCGLGVRDLGHMYRTRQLSPVEVTQATLRRITRLNPELRAYITVLEESALVAARAAEHQLLAGIDLGPMHGVPVAAKDIIRVRGTRTTAGSRLLLAAPLDEEDATVVRRLRGSGAVVIGKLNLHEFGRGEPEVDGPFGNVGNPRKMGHQAGGSSSGSAAAVAAGLAVVSLGTDTGGSVRHPASLCGVVGLKPTYGLVPLTGIIPLSPALDHVGILGRCVADVATSLTAIAGHDVADPTSLLVPVPDYLAALDHDIRGVRVGFPTNPFYRFGQPDALAVLDNGRQALLDLGLTATAVEVPYAEETNDLSRLIIDVDLWSYHHQFRDRETLYTRDFLDKSRLGLETPAVVYAKAKEAQARIRLCHLALFEQIDVIVLPGNVAGAPPHGQTTIEVDGQEYPVASVTSRYDRAWNVAGFPAIAVPVGATPAGLPIALQLVGPPLAEARLLTVAYALERALGNLPAQWGIEPRRD